LMIVLAMMSSAAQAEKVVLDSGVTVLRGQVTAKSASAAIESILFSAEKELTLVIDSPGGSVFAGMRLIDALQSTDKTVTCVVLNGASMAFSIAQACTKRLIVPSAIFMQHQMAGGFEGELPKVLAQTDFVKATEVKLNTMEANRMGLDPSEWAKMHVHEYWMDGNKAVEMKAADDLAQVSCSTKLLNETQKEKVPLFMGISLNLTWSSCPLVFFPKELEIDLGEKKVSLQKLTEKERKMIMNKIEKARSQYDTQKILMKKLMSKNK